MDQQLQAFLDDLRTSHGDNLAAVILYGSAAAGEFRPGSSDFNLLVALDRIAPADLRNAQPCLREWSRLGHPVPVYFTVGELRSAADVFPVEIEQMLKARRVLFGKDVLDGVEVSASALRHQVEYELRSKLIRLRRSYIPASTSAEGIAQLLGESVAAFVALFHAALALVGIDSPVSRHAIVATAAEHFGLDGKSFEKAINIRENNFAEKLNEVSANELFAEYLEQIEKVIAAVDRLEKS